MDINLKGIVIGNHILNNLNKIIRNIIMVKMGIYIVNKDEVSDAFVKGA